MEKYVAVYREGKGVCGALRADMADQVIADFKRAFGGHFFYKPISEEQAKEIRRAITGQPLSSGVEALLSKAVPKQEMTHFGGPD